MRQRMPAVVYRSAHQSVGEEGVLLKAVDHHAVDEVGLPFRRLASA
jgi:hypothetical protein